MAWFRRKRTSRARQPQQEAVLRRIRRKKRDRARLREDLAWYDAAINTFLTEQKQIRAQGWTAEAWSAHLRNWQAERNEVRSKLDLPAAKPLPHGVVFARRWPGEES